MLIETVLQARRHCRRSGSGFFNMLTAFINYV